MMSATFVGNMMGDKNMTMWGDIWAGEAIREFERFDTISEVRHSTHFFPSPCDLMLNYSNLSIVISSILERIRVLRFMRFRYGDICPRIR